MTSGFDARAARYEELRPIDANWWEVYEALVRLGSLRGKRVLEVGCGTGRLSHELEQRELARVWAVDASEAMVERAKALGVNARVARAEALPFKAGWFDAVVMRMALHLFDRPRALEQAARVLSPDGSLVVATEDPASFEDVWFTRFFPSVPEIERARFPERGAAPRGARAAGFGRVEIEHLRQHREQTRERAVDLIRSKGFSTFDLLDPAEFDEGLARAEAELPERFEFTLRLAPRGGDVTLRGYPREWLVLALVALGTLPLVSVLNTQDTSRLALTQSIALRGSVNIDPYWRLTIDRAFANGHWYSDKAPGVALLAVPVYEVVAGRGRRSPPGAPDRGLEPEVAPLGDPGDRRRASRSSR